MIKPGDETPAHNASSSPPAQLCSLVEAYMPQVHKKE